MTNLLAIASYYKAIKVSHSYSIHRSAGLKILVSAVRFRLRAPLTRRNLLFLNNYFFFSKKIPTLLPILLKQQFSSAIKAYCYLKPHQCMPPVVFS